MCGAASAAVTVVILQCIVSILVVAQLNIFFPTQLTAMKEENKNKMGEDKKTRTTVISCLHCELQKHPSKEYISGHLSTSASICHPS